MQRLRDYKKKRDFSTTTEPAGEIFDTGYPLPIFSIQRHDARNLHFDLRLEHNGVLLSWAIARKPVRNKDIKRLAIKVEDHPLDYADFSGFIPKGSYGAGTVDLWDRGFYYFDTARSKIEIAKEMEEKLQKGHFIINLKGQKLDGKFVMVKIGQGANDWLFYYDEDDLHDPDEPDDNQGYGYISPMLPKLSYEIFDSPEWIFEPKLDGYRAVALLDKGRVQIISRNGIDITSSYPLIVTELTTFKEKAVLDGEIIAIDENGKPSFSELRKNDVRNIYYYIFDIMHYKRSSIRHFPLIQRKAILEDVIKDLPRVKKLLYTETNGKAFFSKVAGMGFEGLVAKKKDSKYYSGRTDQWIKIKKNQSLDLFVIGYTPDEHGSFKSLLLAEADDDGSLTYRGNVGTGFSELQKREILKRFKISGRPRNVLELPLNFGEVYVKPNLIIEVEYLEITKEGKLRHPTFKRIRDDK